MTNALTYDSLFFFIKYKLNKKVNNMKFENVSVEAKANIYFDGKVVSHAVTLANGETKTLGIMFQGEFEFSTAAAELMEVIDGDTMVCLKGETQWVAYSAGSSFNVAKDSSFKIKVKSTTAQYVCSYLA